VTDREDAADGAISAVTTESGAAIVLERDIEHEVSLNVYTDGGDLDIYLPVLSDRRSAEILALGRAIVEALDPVPDPPADLAPVEYVTAEPRLPPDVEIRTIALDAAVRVIDQAGGSLVEGAAKIERFLRGEAVEEQTAVEKPRWAVGQELNRADLDELPVGTTVVDGDGDHAVRRPDAPPYAGTIEPRRWTRDLSGDPARLPSRVVAAYPPVTLVSLP